VSASAPTAGKPYVIIGAPVHQDRWVEEQQSVVSGWEVKARWLKNGSIIPVFVPDTADLVSTADLLIRHYGDQLDQLGG